VVAGVLATRAGGASYRSVPMRVLIVEDEGELAVVLARVLDRTGFATDVAATLADACRLYAARRYDAIVLDRRLPDGSGDAIWILSSSEVQSMLLMLYAV